MRRLFETCGGLVLVIATACSGSDELDLGDLSNRTVPGATATATQSPPSDDAGDDDDQDHASAGGGFGTDGVGGFVDTCSVLSDDQVEAATGLTVTGSEDQDNLGCRWFVENVDADILADDAISWQPFTREQFQSQFDAVEQGLEGEEITGIGNRALYIGNEATGEVWVELDDLSFRVGNQFAFTNVEGRPAQEGLAAALAQALG